MKLHHSIEKYFWIFLIAGLFLGLINPHFNDNLMSLLEPLLMTMLCIVFLKSDLLHIITEIKNYKLMLYLVVAYMILIPIIFFFTINMFSQTLALGALILTAMPAAIAAPALTDIVKGNIALSTSITIITSLIAPFSIPALFILLDFENISINPWGIFKNLAIIIFIPILISQIIRKYFSKSIDKSKHWFTPINILLLSILVYIVIGSQREIIVNDPFNVILQVGFLYVVFIALHVIGYFMGYDQNIQNKISICIGAAYMNNGIAIVLAAKFFDPHLLILMVLSDLPWNTLLAPFGKIVNSMKTTNL